MPVNMKSSVCYAPSDFNDGVQAFSRCIACWKDCPGRSSTWLRFGDTEQRFESKLPSGETGSSRYTIYCWDDLSLLNTRETKKWFKNLDKNGSGSFWLNSRICNLSPAPLRSGNSPLSCREDLPSNNPNHRKQDSKHKTGNPKPLRVSAGSCTSTLCKSLSGKIPELNIRYRNFWLVNFSLIKRLFSKWSFPFVSG